LFIGFKDFLLFDPGKSFASLLVMISSIQKKGVVEDTAHIQSPFKFLDLLLCRVKTIFTGFGFQYSVSSPQVLPVQSMQENKMAQSDCLYPIYIS